jgi:hypothetical protein
MKHDYLTKCSEAQSAGSRVNRIWNAEMVEVQLGVALHLLKFLLF